MYEHIKSETVLISFFLRLTSFISLCLESLTWSIIHSQPKTCMSFPEKLPAITGECAGASYYWKICKEERISFLDELIKIARLRHEAGMVDNIHANSWLLNPYLISTPPPSSHSFTSSVSSPLILNDRAKIKVGMWARREFAANSWSLKVETRWTRNVSVHEDWRSVARRA